MRRLAVLLVVPVALLAMGATWPKDTVCVEAHGVSGVWPLREVARRYNENGQDLRLRLRKDCGWHGSIHVRIGDAGGRATGTTRAWTIDGHLAHVNILLDRGRTALFGSWTGCVRRFTVAHELGHAVGMRHHLHRPGSVMAYAGWQRRCGGFDHLDRTTLRRLYP